MRLVLRISRPRRHKAELMWVVSLDGKKTQSETYKVLAVLDKAQDKN
jgi:hypothetical protein